jgi:hypothetical protein
MSNLQEIMQAIEQLSLTEFSQLRRFVERLTEERDHGIIRAVGTPEERIAALHQALKEFREGLTEEELVEVIWTMNYEIGDPVPPRYQRKI